MQEEREQEDRNILQAVLSTNYAHAMQEEREQEDRNILQAVLSTNYAHAMQEGRGSRRTGTSSRLSSSLPITASGTRHRPNSLFHKQMLVIGEDEHANNITFLGAMSCLFLPI
jgi:hypothetical protein